MNFGLNKKIITVGMLVLGLFIIMLWYSNKVIEQLANDIELSKNVNQVNQLAELMKNTSNQYHDNAPRDYESYNRDLKVFYIGLKNNLASLDALIETSGHDYFNRNSFASLLIDTAIIEKNDAAFKQMVLLYNNFTKGFEEKIGDNPEEPRLEWANEYISTDVSGLFLQIKQTDGAFKQLFLAQRQATININRYVSISITLILIILMLWFNQAIIKRILRVAKACKEVSLGNYGLKLKDKSTDEIGRLVHDFNLLSGKLDSMFTLLNEIHKAGSTQQTMDVILKETKPLINASAIFLLLPKGDTYQVKTVASNSSKTDVVDQQLVNIDSCLSWISDEQDHLVINDMLSHTVEAINTHFAKYLLHSLKANSLFVIKIFDNNQEGLLLFAKTQKSGFNQQHIDSIQGLNSMFGNILLSKL